jgi:hypothetical protein
MSGFETRCEECAFDPASVTPDSAAATVRDFGRRYKAPLTRLLRGEDESVLRTRPVPDVWSAIEYAAHVRDVFALFDRRVAQIVTNDDPVLEVIDHDALVDAGDYRSLGPVAVADDLAAAAEALASRLEGLAPEHWHRAGTRQGERRTVLEIAQRAGHEGSHHLLDIGRVLRAVRQSPDAR